MTDEREQPDLSTIEPIAPAPGDDEAATGSSTEDGDGISRGVAEPIGTPTVVVEAEPISDQDDGDEAGARGLDG